MKKIFILALCALLMGGTISAKTTKKATPKATKVSTAAFESDYQKLMDSLNVVGSAVVVVKDNKIVYSHEFGLKNKETGEKMQANTIFRIASISKSFTATAIMQLAEQGKVDIKADVSKYLKWKMQNIQFPDVPITLEMLMSHSSSLNDTQGYWESFDPVIPEKNPNFYKCYNCYKPGTGYEYCNYAFNIMSSVIENVTGQRFDKYIVEHVMRPLGIQGGYCVDDLDHARFATLYSWEGGKFVARPEAYARPEVLDNYKLGESCVRLSACGGVKVTATELAKYMLMHMNYGKSPLAQQRIISEASSRRMQTVITDDCNANITAAEKERAGLGLVHANFYVPGVELVGHTGGAYGMRSAMFFDPVKKYGFVVITNGAQKGAILGASMRAMYKHFIGDLPKKTNKK